MTTAQSGRAATTVVYDLVGTMLEACSCGILCPCWVGEDPDTGFCDSFNAYHFDSGVINGIDVSGLNFVRVVHIPGNVLAGSWREVIFLDDTAGEEQATAILDAYQGRLGGPLADFAGLIGETVAVERAPIAHEVRGGKGTLQVGEILSAVMEPYRGPDGTASTLRDSLFSTVPGSPAYVGKASSHVVNLPQFGMVWSFTDRNAIQSDYRITYQTP